MKCLWLCCFGKLPIEGIPSGKETWVIIIKKCYCLHIGNSTFSASYSITFVDVAFCTIIMPSYASAGVILIV